MLTKFTLIFNKVDSRLQYDLNKNIVSADIGVGQYTSPLVPIHLQNTTATTIPESGTHPPVPSPAFPSILIAPWSLFLLNFNTSACARLIKHTFNSTELASLIEATFSSEEETGMIRRLHVDDAQTFVDVISQARYPLPAIKEHFGTDSVY